MNTACRTLDNILMDDRLHSVCGSMDGQDNRWRRLCQDELDMLLSGGNFCDDWNSFLVPQSGFRADLIRNCRFSGTVRIGRITRGLLEYGSLRFPTGIYGSFIENCDIGDDCAIHNAGIVSRYIVHDGCLIFNVGQMTTGLDADFGCPALADRGIAVMNESGSRAVLPFDGMNTADAFLYAKYRDDLALQERLADMTLRRNSALSGKRGEIGPASVIKNTLSIENAMLGEGCVVDCACRLKNVTVDSSASEPVRIGENAVLEDGIVGFGCRLYEGCTARHFILGSNCTLKSGVRFYDSILGDNGTVACCEVLNSLIFPAHEQHHNNSFLIAALVCGQSNIAAGATLGSNHNSRRNDGELVAGRGFWPGLCVSLKHSSSFAPFTLLSKGSYPYELDIRLPFSLVSDNEREGMLEVMPAYWWMYDMYALARNGAKYKARDTRKTRRQNIEFDIYAPDCMEQVMQARSLLELWTGTAARRRAGATADGVPERILREEGAALLGGGPSALAGLEVLGYGMERSSRRTRILKPAEAYAAYADMVVHYAVRCILDYRDRGGEVSLGKLSALACASGERRWVNLGGQVMRECDVEDLRREVALGSLAGWDDIHARYDCLFARYPEDRLAHALQCLALLEGWDGSVRVRDWMEVFAKEERICREICGRVSGSRKKDFDNVFRQATFRNADEMSAVSGSLDDDAFIRQTETDTESMLLSIARLKAMTE